MVFCYRCLNQDTMNPFICHFQKDDTIVTENKSVAFQGLE
jgi:hypothetical protein